MILATAENAADAVTGTPCGAALNAPILLTDPGQLSTAVGEEIRRVLPAGGTVYVMGLEAAVTDPVRAEAGHSCPVRTLGTPTAPSASGG